MDDQLIGKTIYHPGGPLTDQNQMLGRTSLYKEDGTPLVLPTDEELSSRYPTVFNVVGYGATGNGTTNDSTAIQAAIDACAAAGGGQVFFPAGTYRCNVIAKPKVVLVGVGQNTVLKCVSGANTDVIKGLNFDTLTDKVYASGDTLLGCYSFGLQSLHIDGDKSNQASGWGVRVWGAKLHFRDVVVYNCKSGGIWTEFTTHDAGAFSDLIDPIFDSIKIQGCDGDGWRFRGPHDAYINNLSTVSNTGWGFRSESDTASNKYRSSFYGNNWNSWLNANSFYFADGFMLTNAAATGTSGVGVEYKAGVGNCKFHGIIAGHTTGMLVRGGIHDIQVTAFTLTTAIQLGSAGAGNEYAGGTITILGTGIGTVINFTNASWPSIIRGRVGNIATALTTGSGSSGDTLDLLEVGGSSRGVFSIPGNKIYASGTGYTPIMPKSNGTILTWEATQTTVGASGAASALPANPVGYFRIADPSGTLYKVPYYNV